ncbi:MAG: hypothetical protein COA62_14640 [Rhodobiaceae bacterium]|nr:MAG: hypothetical protein COA62_14640 [Rhodobiaceae bacterium]
MKRIQDTARIAILAGASLLLFAGGSNAQGIECPPGAVSIEDPAAPGKYFCIDPVMLLNGASFTSPHSDISISLENQSEGTAEDAMRDFEALNDAQRSGANTN